MDIIIRPEGPSDYKEIFRVTALAFERDNVFLALELQPDGLKGHEGIVEFPEEYNDCMD